MVIRVSGVGVSAVPVVLCRAAYLVQHSSRSVSTIARRYTLRLTKRVTPLIVGLLVSVGSSRAASTTFTAFGTSDPFLSGMPSGSTCCGGDSAPAESPVLVTGLGLTPGTALTFTHVTGSTSYVGGTPTDTPDGSAFYGSGPANGIGSYNAPIDALVGVFLDNSQPDSSAAPAGLDFATIGTNFTSLSPLLKQVFFIGDGLTGAGSGSQQTFIIPTGATRLFLGTVDGFGWYNNSGSITGTINSAGTSGVPEPQSYFMILAGICVLISAMFFKSRRATS